MRSAPERQMNDQLVHSKSGETVTSDPTEFGRLNRRRATGRSGFFVSVINPASAHSAKDSWVWFSATSALRCMWMSSDCVRVPTRQVEICSVEPITAS